MRNVFQDVYFNMAKSSFELFFPLWGFPPLFPSQRPESWLFSACASHWTLPFVRLDSSLVGKGPDILPSTFHPNRMKSKPAGENQRIKLSSRRQHYFCPVQSEIIFHICEMCFRMCTLIWQSQVLNFFSSCGVFPPPFPANVRQEGFSRRALPTRLFCYSFWLAI